MNELLEKLISMKTVSSDLAEQEHVLLWIKEQLPSILYCEEIIHNSVPSLFARTSHTKKPRVLLMAHVDVVPAPLEQFTARYEGGRLFGRGAIDMKFAIACYLRLFDEISTELSSLDIGLCITTDEEVGGQYGAAKLAEGGYGGDVLFLPDGGTSWEFEERAKGMQHFEIIAHGKSVHASRPWDGIDPMPILMNALRDMYALFPHEPCGDADHFHSSMSVGKITGGDVSNQLASSVHAFIDIRAFADDHARIRQGITDIQERYEGLSVISLVDGEAYENDISHTDFELFRTLAASQGISVGRATAHGSSDARFFSKRGMPSLMVSPQGGGHHSAYEWVDVNDLELYYAIFKEWTRTLAREASSSSRHSRAEALAKADCPVHRKRI